RAERECGGFERLGNREQMRAGANQDGDRPPRLLAPRRLDTADYASSLKLVFPFHKTVDSDDTAVPRLCRLRGGVGHCAGFVVFERREAAGEQRVYPFDDGRLRTA